MSKPQPLMDPGEAAEYLCVCRDTLLRLTRKRRIPVIKITSRAYRYEKKALDKYIRAHRVEAV